MPSGRRERPGRSRSLRSLPVVGDRAIHRATERLDRDAAPSPGIARASQQIIRARRSLTCAMTLSKASTGSSSPAPNERRAVRADRPARQLDPRVIGHGREARSPTVRDRLVRRVLSVVLVWFRYLYGEANSPRDRPLAPARHSAAAGTPSPCHGCGSRSGGRSRRWWRGDRLTLQLEELADTGRRQFDHAVHLLGREGRLLGGALDLHEAIVIEHDHVEVDPGTRVLRIVEVEQSAEPERPTLTAATWPVSSSRRPNRCMAPASAT